MSPRLSVQLGIRYDAMPHAWERGNNVANFDPALYLQSEYPQWNTDGSMNPSGPGFTTPPGLTQPWYLNGMGLAGQNGFPRGLVTNDYNTWQPRIGFSEDLFGNGKTVLRGGFGTFFERMQGNDIYNAATAPPFANNPSASNVYFSDPHTSWATGATAALPNFPSGGWENLAYDYPAPAVAQYSLGIQHQLAPSVIWVVQYVGNLAWHQNIERDINNLPLSEDMAVRCDQGDGSNKYNAGAGPSGNQDICPATTLTGTTTINANLQPPVGSGYAHEPATLPNLAIYRPYAGYGEIKQEENTTNGTYNGFQTGIRTANKWGLSGEFDYTWSHEIDITSYDLDPVSDPWNLKYDKGSGALDRRNILSANYVYLMPLFAHGSGLAHSTLGGWTLAGTVIGETGTIPSNQGPGLSLSYDPIGLGGNYTNRPNQVAKVTYPKTQKQWFSTSSFAAPTPVWLGGANQGFGNAHKDAIVGPGRVNFDTSLYKSFALTEGMHVEMRFESFNTFNHTEFNNISYQEGSGNFGQVTTTWDPRVLELGGKFVF